MEKKNLFWMNYSINLANNLNGQSLKVGAVLVDSNNRLWCSTISSVDNKSNWCIDLIKQMDIQGHKGLYTLYLTISTLSSNKKFDLNILLKHIAIDKIYLGVPDPDLDFYSKDDPIISLSKIYRYPDYLQQEIIKQNKQIYDNSNQSIKLNLYYSEKRISKLVMDGLAKYKLDVTKSELNKNKNADNLKQLIAKKYNLEISSVSVLIDKILSEAFNEKYAKYDYADDARSANILWRSNFILVCNKLGCADIRAMQIINVGVGSGNEARQLFKGCEKLTFVDIAKGGLEKVKKDYPQSKILALNAEKLAGLQSDSYDMYISLRTFNSSFFNIKKSVREAYRVIKNSGNIIISVANGFLYTGKKSIIPGLIIPGTEFVDIYRGLDETKEIYREMQLLNMKQIEMLPTNTEIYIFAKK